MAKASTREKEHGVRPSTDAETLVDSPSAEHQQVMKADPKLGQALKRENIQVSGTHDGAIYIKNSPTNPESPRGWPTWKRYCIVGLASFLNNIVTIGVNSWAPAAEQIQDQFGVSAEVGTLSVVLYVAGFAIGPLLCAPLSEFYGRRPVYLVFWALYTVFWIGLALSPNIGSILVFRFLLGFFGSTPLANTGGVVHDLFPKERCGYAVALYALSSTDGPPFGNAVGGFIAQQQSWHWVCWFNLILAGVFWVVIFFCLPETRDTIITMRQARRLRKETGNENIYAEHEKSRNTKGHFYKVSLVRPWKFFFTEPITYACALINAYTYAIIFMSNEAFPLIFGEGNGGHGWTLTGVINLTYLSYVVGSVLGFCIQPLQEYYYRRGSKKFRKAELRWVTCCAGVFLMPIGFMIAAWTAYPNITYWGPIIGFTLFGIGFFTIINAILNYVVDAYGHYAASALAAVVSVRNIAGAGFPLFARQMFLRMDNNWALFFLSCLSMFMIPVPFWLLYRGDRVRKASPYCREHFDEDD